MQTFLDTKPLSLDELPSIDDSLRAFRAHIRAYRKALNSEGIWLFLSTVGCWGVPQPIYQFVAYGLTIVLFGDLVTSRYSERKSFSTLAKDLEARIIRETITAEERTRQLLLLEQFRKVYLTGWRPFWGSRVFFLCWLFYGASFGYAILHLT